MGEELVGSAVIMLKADANGVIQGFANAVSKIIEFKSTTEKVTTAMGLAFVAVGGLALGIGVKSTKAAEEFETSMQNIAGNTNMTTKELKFMKETVLDLGAKSGLAFDALGQGYMHITNLGYNGAEATKILTAAMKSAVSTGSDVGEVANSLTNVMKDFGIGANHAEEAMNQLHTVAATGNMTLEQLVLAFGQTAGEAGNLGLKLPDVGAAMAAMTRHGVTASEAGTQLKNLLIQIAAPTDKAKGAIDALSKSSGVNLSKDFTEAGLKAKGLSGVLADVAKATHGSGSETLQLMTGVKLTTKELKAMQEAQGGNMAAIKSMTPNMRGMYAAYVLTNNGAKDYQESLKAITQAQKEDTVDRLYKEKMNTTNQQWKVMQANMQKVEIEIGSTLLPILNRLMQQVLPIVEAIDKWIQKNQKIIPNILGVGLAIGGLGGVLLGLGKGIAVAKSIGSTIMGVGKFVKLGFGLAKFAAKDFMTGISFLKNLISGGWSAAMKAANAMQSAYNFLIVEGRAQQFAIATASKAYAAAQWLVNAAMDAMPIILIIAGIVALIAVIVYMITHWKQVSSVVKQVWSEVVSAVQHAFSWLIQEIPKALMQIFDFIYGWQIKLIAGAVNIGISWIKGFIKGIQNAVGGVGQVLGSIGKMLIGHSPPPEGALSEIDTGAQNIGSAWSENFAKGIAGGKSGLNNLLGSIGSGMNVGQPSIGGMASPVSTKSHNIDNSKVVKVDNINISVSKADDPASFATGLKNSLFTLKAN